MAIPTKTTPESEFWAQLVHPYYTPRPNPMAIPAVRWDEAPCWVLCINEEWASHVLALLDELDQHDTWLGTDEEIDAARIQVNEFIACFMESGSMCCCGGSNQTPAEPVLHRATADGQLQVSYDGGLTWQTDPNDIRVTGTTLPAPVTSGQSATKCDAATNGLEHLKDAVAAVSEALGVGATVVAVMSAIVTFIVSIMFGSPEVIPFLFPLVVALATAAFGVGQAAFDAAFTNTVWDAMLCILYCHIGADGHFTQSGFQAVLADIPLNIADSIASYQLGEIIKAMGLNGLNNICSYGNASLSDCAACACDTCGSDWVVGSRFNAGGDPIGTIDSFGIDEVTGRWYFVMSSENDGAAIPSQAIFLTSNDSNNCCNVNASDFEFISGAATVTSYVECGQALTSFQFGWIGTKNINSMGLAAGVGDPFQVKIFFEVSP